MNEKVIEALSYRTIRYVRNMDDFDSDSPTTPYEVVFTMSQWNRLLKEMGIDAI